MSRFLLLFLILGGLLSLSTAFLPIYLPPGRRISALDARRKSEEPNAPDYLFDDFRTSSGELLNPYQVLKVSRTADGKAIKKSYRDLSRRYHPDGVRHKDILPGNCNNLAEVRDHWERIRLSYEILSNPKMRKRYDRNVVLADPAAAVKRAAVDAAFSGVKGVASGVGQGIFNLGAFAFKQMTKDRSEKKKPVSMEGDTAATEEI